MKYTMPLLVSVGVFAIYTSCSPGAISQMGYTGEEMGSGDRLLTILDAYRQGVPEPPMTWSRHGPLPVLFDIPFIVAAKILHISPDFVLSFSPILFTTALITILFLWLRKVASPGMTIFLTLAAALGTMLWPYAHIGLETKQSLLVLLAGYWALNSEIKGWPGTIGFAILCGLVVSVKSTSITLTSRCSLPRLPRLHPIP